MERLLLLCLCLSLASVSLVGCDAQSLLSKFKGESAQTTNEQPSQAMGEMTHDEASPDEYDEYDEYDEGEAVQPSQTLQGKLNQRTVTCVNPDVINQVKFVIKDRAVSAIEEQKMAGVAWLANVHTNDVADHIHNSTNIELKHIQEQVDGGCRATAVISYHTKNKEFAHGELSYIAFIMQFIKTNNYQFNAVEQVAELFDVHFLNVSDVTIVNHDSYSGVINYHLQNSYTETGEVEQQIHYELGVTSNFLATLSAVEYHNAHRENIKAQQEQKAKQQQAKAQQAQEKACQDKLDSGEFPAWRRRPEFMNTPLTNDMLVGERCLSHQSVNAKLQVDKTGKITDVMLTSESGKVDDDIAKEMTRIIKRASFEPMACLPDGKTATTQLPMSFDCND